MNGFDDWVDFVFLLLKCLGAGIIGYILGHSDNDNDKN